MPARRRSQPSPSDATPPPALRRAVGLEAVLVLVVGLLFGQTLSHEFVRSDDVDLVAGNLPFLSELSNAPRLFTRSYFEIEGELSSLETYYRPLVVLSLMLDAQFGGPEPAVYHRTNVVLHTMVVVLLFGLMMRLGAGRWAAFAAALLFAVHPLNTSTVAWIAGRNDSLLAVFALVSLVGLDATVRGSRSSPWGPGLHLAAFVLALFTKETAIVLLPAYAMLVWFWYERPMVYREVRWLPWSYAAAVVAWGTVRQLALAGGEGGATPMASMTTAVGNLPQLLAYVGKVVFPIDLHVMPSVDARALGLGVLGLGVLALTFRRLPLRRSAVVLAWFILFLLPPLVVPDLPAYEHRVYVPLLGLALGLSQLPGLAARLGSLAWPRLVCSALVVVFALLTLRQLPVFRDPLTFWASATRGSSYAPIAHVNVGRILEELGEPGRAAAEYRAALAIDPLTPKANNNLGVTLMAQGREATARRHFERELEVNPINAEAHFNIGLFEKISGRPADGVPHWETALSHNSFFLPAYEELVEYYRGVGDDANANAYQERLEALLDPD